MKGIFKITSGIASLGLLAACGASKNIDPKPEETILRAKCTSAKAFDLESENNKRVGLLRGNPSAMFRTTIARDEVLGVCQSQLPMIQKAANDVVLPMNASSEADIDIIRVEKDCQNLTARLVLQNGSLEIRGQIVSIDVDHVEIDDGQVTIKVEKVLPEKYDNVTRYNVKGFRKSLRPEYSYAKFLDEQGISKIRVTVTRKDGQAQGIAGSTVIEQETVIANPNEVVQIHQSTLDCANNRAGGMLVFNEAPGQGGMVTYTVGEVLNKCSTLQAQAGDGQTVPQVEPEVVLVSAEGESQSQGSRSQGDTQSPSGTQTPGEAQAQEGEQNGARQGEVDLIASLQARQAEIQARMQAAIDQQIQSQLQADLDQVNAQLEAAVTERMAQAIPAEEREQRMAEIRKLREELAVIEDQMANVEDAAILAYLQMEAEALEARIAALLPPGYARVIVEDVPNRTLVTQEEQAAPADSGEQVAGPAVMPEG